jgi:hypothetical protein
MIILEKHISHSNFSEFLIFSISKLSKKLSSNKNQGIPRMSQPTRPIRPLGLINKPNNNNQKVNTTQQKRQEYRDIKSTFTVNPRGKKMNPLAKEQDSEWSLFFENEKLKKVIMLDINRFRII